MNLHFSPLPGCFERQLQRQYRNPLFIHCATPVTQLDIEEARRQDEQERQAFYQTFQTVLQQITTLAARVEAEVILKLKTQIDSLYEQCAGLGGGDYPTEKQALRQLNQLIMQAILDSGIQSPQLRADLEREEVARQMHFDRLEYPFIAHLLHPQSPITKDNLIPTLLSEEEAPLRVAMGLFDPQQQQLLYQEANRLLSQLEQEGHSLPAVWERLTCMTPESVDEEYYYK